MPKRILTGTVVSDKNDKTIVVEVERRFTHPLLKKTVRRSKNYHAHDEANSFKVSRAISAGERAATAMPSSYGGWISGVCRISGQPRGPEGV